MNMKDIILPPPETAGGIPLMEAFGKRASHRKCSEKAIDLQDISNLLWSAYGFNRDGFRTAPSSHNRQEMELYIFLKSGVYLYDASGNRLIQKSDGDLRALTGAQDFVAEVPMNIAFVADTSKITGKTPQGVLETIFVDTGFISENIYLYAAGAGLNTVIRAMFDREKLSAALKLRPEQTITMVQSVGHPTLKQ
ncbi:MAG: SagB/ThcOx family dehydrogenase [Bacteroidales bacterium]|nr:SagB/ThcOx family dehydrogenase [Candidatus Cacconaster scatequi]